VQFYILAQELAFILEEDNVESTKYCVASGCGDHPSPKPENIMSTNPTNNMRHATMNCNAQMTGMTAHNPISLRSFWLSCGFRGISK
jgi:hypothetical protein